MTGRVQYTPEAERQLDEIDDWIASKATPDIAHRFVEAVLEHIEGIPALPFAGRARDDVRPGMRTTTYKKRTLVAYEVGGTPGELVITILGVFHGGQNWEAALGSSDDSAGA